MWYFIAFFIGIPILFFIVVHIVSIPESKRRREFRRWIKESLGGLDPKAEKRNVLALLEENLPKEYLCRIMRRRRRCNGILLRSSIVSYYICSECRRFRSTVRIRGD